LKTVLPVYGEVAAKPPEGGLVKTVLPVHGEVAAKPPEGQLLR